MSKFFMFGSELQELEQLMIVVQRIRNEEGERGRRDYERFMENCKLYVIEHKNRVKEKYIIVYFSILFIALFI